MTFWRVTAFIVPILIGGCVTNSHFTPTQNTQIFLSMPCSSSKFYSDFDLLTFNYAISGADDPMTMYDKISARHKTESANGLGAFSNFWFYLPEKNECRPGGWGVWFGEYEQEFFTNTGYQVFRTEREDRRALHTALAPQVKSLLRTNNPYLPYEVGDTRAGQEALFDDGFDELLFVEYLLWEKFVSQVIACIEDAKTLCLPETYASHYVDRSKLSTARRAPRESQDRKVPTELGVYQAINVFTDGRPDQFNGWSKVIAYNTPCPNEPFPVWQGMFDTEPTYKATILLAIDNFDTKRTGYGCFEFGSNASIAGALAHADEYVTAWGGSSDWLVKDLNGLSLQPS